MKIIWGVPPTGPTALLLWKRRIAQKLSRLIEEKNLTAPRLAFKSGLPAEFINRVLKAKIYPSHKARTMLADALDVTEEFLDS